MNLSLNKSENLARDLVDKFSTNNNEVVVCPDFVSLKSVQDILHQDKNKIKLGAQDVFWQDFGSYTGEISCHTLEELGCKYVIIGHSERRENLCENDKIINNKVQQVIQSSRLIPIICIGESLEKRNTNSHELFLINQIELALSGVNLEDRQVIIAYEPIWAIGSGKTIEAKEAEHIHKIIYAKIEDMFGSEIAKNNFQIIYGGSVKSVNVESFIGLEHIDGFLVGGASLNADEFCQIVSKGLEKK